VSLPDLIEILPLSTVSGSSITVPGSKSITNRALILAALADGEVTLEGALWSEDTQVMVNCLQELGFMVNVAPDLGDACNRTITVYGKAGEVPRGGSETQPMELFVGNAGTAARFLAAMVCLGSGVYRLHGVPRMHERPQQALLTALRELGYQVDSSNDRLPALIYGNGARPGQCRVSIAESSQFASALMLCALKGRWQVRVEGENSEESPYVRMTERMLEAFPHQGGRFQIEPDASGGSYFSAASAFVEAGLIPAAQDARLDVRHWPVSGWQIDGAFPGWARRILSARTDAGEQVLGVSRQIDLGDSIMTGIVLAPFGRAPTRFTELGRLRLQECERVQALRTELERCGGRVVEADDALTVFPSSLHGAEIETYNDHRMAMCFAVVALLVPGIHIRNPACVKKTFPNFFQKLAESPPSGLGAGILDSRNGTRLAGSELFAD
jgi:3-phosphoshikimate 1-carboxyvinyltransferase